MEMLRCGWVKVAPTKILMSRGDPLSPSLSPSLSSSLSPLPYPIAVTQPVAELRALL